MSLDRLGIITGVLPIAEGWRYLQPFKDGYERIPSKGCAGSGRNLVELVKVFRATNHIDMGDPEGDVAEYIREVSPINDRFPGRALRKDEPGTSPGFRPLIERIRDWLLFMAPKRPRLLIQDEAEVRAAICAKCKHNVKWRTGCLPCCEEVNSRGINLRQKTDFAPADALEGCRLHDFHLPSAVFVDRDYLGDVAGEAPKRCWMRQFSTP